MTLLLVLGLVVFGAGGAYAASAHLGLAKGHHHGKKHAKKHHAKKHHGRHHSVNKPATTAPDNGQNAAQNQYGTRPGKGCGDRNHVHTGPPGNPSNTACPPQSQKSAANKKSKSKARHHARHHARTKHGHKHGKKH